MKWPGIKILDRYIIRKFLGTYVFAIAFIIIIIVIFDAAEKIDDFIETKAPLSSIVFAYYFNFIPFFINQFSGLFTFIAVIFFTSKMAYNTEIVAILSGGVSFKRMLWPYFLAASAITIVSILLNFFVIPVANENRLKFEDAYFVKNRRVQFERNIYRQIEPGTFAYIRDYRVGDNMASFFALESYVDGTMTASLEASDVAFDSATQRWTAPKYIVKAFSGEDVKFEKKEGMDTLINLTTDELNKVEKLVQTMNYGRLNRFIKQQKSKGSDLIRVFEVERANRLAYPMSTFVLTLIGVSLSSRKVRGGTGLHIGLGIALCFSYILFMRFGEEFAKGGLLPTALAVWIPNIIYTVIAVVLYRNAPK